MLVPVPLSLHAPLAVNSRTFSPDYVHLPSHDVIFPLTSSWHLSPRLSFPSFSLLLSPLIAISPTLSPSLSISLSLPTALGALPGGGTSRDRVTRY